MRRLLFVDDNVHAIEGHYFELASLLLQGADELGYQAELATHVDFDTTIDSSVAIFPALHARRMLAWSLGVDGRSRVSRNTHGRPIGGTALLNGLQLLRDRLCAKHRRPKTLLSRWSDDLVAWLRCRSVTSDDTLVINTGDDFLLIALSNALETLGEDAPGNVHVIFHFAVYDSGGVDSRATQFGEQVNRVLETSNKHRIQLHATTQSLAEQLRSVGVDVSAIAYPTRHRDPVPYSAAANTDPVNILFAGLPRREKGSKSLSKLLSTIDAPHLQSGNYRVSMQLPKSKWKRMVPTAMHANCLVTNTSLQENGTRSLDKTIDVITSSLTTPAYHDWLDTAGIGLFLYAPERYVARCSGALLEFLVRGIPIVVPNNCWLGQQVKAAGGNGSVGYIYDSIEEISGILDVIGTDYEALRKRAQQFASVIAGRHHPTQTLLAMGINTVKQSAIAA